MKEASLKELNSNDLLPVEIMSEGIFEKNENGSIKFTEKIHHDQTETRFFKNQDAWEHYLSKHSKVTIWKIEDRTASESYYIYRSWDKWQQYKSIESLYLEISYGTEFGIWQIQNISRAGNSVSWMEQKSNWFSNQFMRLTSKSEAQQKLQEKQERKTFKHRVFAFSALALGSSTFIASNFQVRNNFFNLNYTVNLPTVTDLSINLVLGYSALGSMNHYMSSLNSLKIFSLLTTSVLYNLQPVFAQENLNSEQIDSRTTTSDWLGYKFNSNGDLIKVEYEVDHQNIREFQLHKATDGGFIITNKNKVDLNLENDLWISRFNSNGEIMKIENEANNQNNRGLKVQRTSDGGFIINAEITDENLAYINNLLDKEEMVVADQPEQRLSKHRFGFFGEPKPEHKSSSEIMTKASVKDNSATNNYLPENKALGGMLLLGVSALVGFSFWNKMRRRAVPQVVANPVPANQGNHVVNNMSLCSGS